MVLIGKQVPSNLKKKKNALIIIVLRGSSNNFLFPLQVNALRFCSSKKDSTSLFSQEVPTAFPPIDATNPAGSELPWQTREVIYRILDRFSF